MQYDEQDSAWQHVLIGMVRRVLPEQIAYDLAGVQPMAGPTGLIFIMGGTALNAYVDYGNLEE